jgi:hypothetical protein
MKIISLPPPVDCATFLPGFDFADAYGVLAPVGLDAPEAARRAFAHAPQWAAMLIDLRNRLVAPFGLKSAPATGFPVISERPDQVVMGFDDRHLDFRIIVTVASGVASVTTIVRRHNLGGRLYLAAIMPFHRLIARAFVAKIAVPLKAKG